MNRIDPLSHDLARCRNGPSDPDAWRSLCENALARGQVSIAREAVDGWLRAAPGDWRAMLRSALVDALAGKPRLAKETAGKAVSMAEPGFDDHATLGLIYSYANDARSAEGPLRAALQQGSGNDTALLYNLAVTLRMTGEFAEAEGLCARMLQIDPRNFDALCLRSELRKQTPAANHVAELREIIGAGGLPSRQEARLRFALAKELEDLGQGEESFVQITRACELNRAGIRYDVAGDLETLRLIRQHHDRAGLSKMTDGDASASPIFIVGLPRTGTTLVERMLTMHQKIGTVGESNAFALELVEQVKRAGPVASRAQMVRQSLEIDSAALGRAYQFAVGADLSPGLRLVDKMPLNYLYLGLIDRALPNASIILLERDPMDSIFAMLKSQFAGAYPFSYSQAELSAYYVEWHALMAGWKAVLGDRLLTVRYEDLVNDPEPLVRRMLTHCGLPYDPACLRFTENSEASQTLSAVQVRQPLHTRSIGRWRKHAAGLHEASQVLAAAGLLSA